MEGAFPHSNRSGFTFLDEFRLVASNGKIATAKFKLDLLVFDTSLPPGSRKHFSIAPTHFRYDAQCTASIYTDSNGPRGEGPCHKPFIVDPTQSVVVIYLHHYHHPGPPRRPAWTVVFVIRAGALVRYMSSTPSGKRIPWEKWKRDVTVVEFPGDGVPYIPTFVLGTHVLFLRRNGQGGYYVHLHNFSLWGCRALVRVGGGLRRKRRALPEPEKIWSPGEFAREVWKMQTLGDTLAMCSVGDSPFNCTGGLCLVRKESSFPKRYTHLGVDLVTYHRVHTR